MYRARQRIRDDRQRGCATFAGLRFGAVVATRAGIAIGRSRDPGSRCIRLQSNAVRQTSGSELVGGVASGYFHPRVAPSAGRRLARMVDEESGAVCAAAGQYFGLACRATAASGSLRERQWPAARARAKPHAGKGASGRNIGHGRKIFGTLGHWRSGKCNADASTFDPRLVEGDVAL